jgi:ABC-type iron transport system FetAB permease component
MIAVHYQVVVMYLVFGASGMSAAIFLTLLPRGVSAETLSR